MDRSAKRLASPLPLGSLAFLLTALTLQAAEPRFTEKTQGLGIDFVHRHGGTGEKFMNETMGSGLAVLDANGDERLDLFFVQSDPKFGHRLYVQTPEGRFEDWTQKSGLAGKAYGMGVAAGDIDRDGDTDLFVSSFGGGNVLFRNQGGGVFEDATAGSGLQSPLWAVSAGFFDAEGDGDLDLYVVNYVDFSLQNHKWCGDAKLQIRAYCHPDVYNAVPDALYLNDGTGRFTEGSAAAGIVDRDGKGLGLTFGDVDGDGKTDIYVANDSTMNFLFLGEGQGRFTETALLAGVGFNGAGAAEAGMGTWIADADGDGLQDIFVTNLDFESATLYRNEGQRVFRDVTESAALSEPTMQWVGFGTVATDHDNDGDLDIFVTNGHIIDNIEKFQAGRRYRQPCLLLDNLGNGRFADLTPALGFSQDLAGRGVVAADLDGDGDEDLVISQNDGPAFVLWNQFGSRNRSLTIRLKGKISNPDAIGARVILKSGGRVQIRDLSRAVSYASQQTSDLVFGLGQNAQAEEVLIRWPSGQEDRLGPLSAGSRYTVEEGSATPRVTAFRAPNP